MSRLDQLDKNFATAQVSDGLRWHDVKQWAREGQGWKDTEAPFDRLPARAKAIVRPEVWELSQQTAGLHVRFVTSARRIAARWTLRFPALALDHMPASGVSGLDLYLRDRGTWRWTGVGRAKERSNSVTLVDLPPAPGVPGRPAPGSTGSSGPPEITSHGLREFLLYLPLYNGLDELHVGLPEDAQLQPAPPWPGGGGGGASGGKPIVFYGTSIVQGGVASRPGMAYPAIIGRMLDGPTINLGFSGNGPMDPEMAPLVSELDASIYVLDALPNMEPETVEPRVALWVELLRREHPATPIVLVENLTYQNALHAGRTELFTARNTALRAAFARLLAHNVPGIHLIPGETLLGNDWEATIDGSHPSDLGFMRMAQAIAPVLRTLGTTGVA